MLDYGIVGNCLTCALVKKNASVDWMCYPDFASPSLFCKILDQRKGGSFDIVARGYAVTQEYLDDTAILVTNFTSKDKKHMFEVYDFFPRYRKLVSKNHSKLISRNEFVRIIKPLMGKPEIKVRLNLQPNYARDEVDYEVRDGKLCCKSDTTSVAFISNVNYSDVLKSEKFVLDTTKYFVIGKPGTDATHFNVKYTTQLLNATKKYWKKWVGTLVLPEENRELIIRSAITLKLLTFSKTGAIVAASTTSIPEAPGTERNWDYRFCWVRDASFTVDALKKIGRDYEAKKLLEFIIGQVEKNDFIHIMYGIHGEAKLTEHILPHLDGFKDSKPVRIGNAAYNQIQHDVYGDILEILYLYYGYYEYEKKFPRKYLRFMKFIVNQIKFSWDRVDSGIWEFRGLLRHYTYSKFMCYVGVDRAIKLAQHFNLKVDINDWLELRDEIKNSLLQEGYNKEVEAFTMYYGADNLDASMLQMTYYDFLGDDDPRVINTVKAIYNDLRTDYLVQRYNDKDDFGDTESSHIICSFWLVDSLYMIGEEDKARRIYNKLIKHSNHLGLYAEDIHIATKKLIGNFPQAYTHIALINSSILLSEWSSKRKKIDWSTLPKRGKLF